MGDISEEKQSEVIRLTGGDEAHQVDIQLIDGEPSLRTFGIQAIESLRGFDPQCDTWYYIGNELDSTGVGAENDEIEMDILAGIDPVMFPAINLVYTLTAQDESENDEDATALRIAAYYNTQAPFNVLWRAQRIAGSGCVYISAKKPGGHFERPNVGDFVVSATGTTTANVAFDKIIRQNKITGLARDPADPRQGQLGIQGSVTQTEGDVTSRFENVYDLMVNGSGTPVEFTETADPVNVKFITSVIISGVGNGIKYGQFLSKSGGPLSNGLVLDYKSKDIVLSRPPYLTTDDLDDLHAGNPAQSKLSVQSGGDKYASDLEFGSALEIRPQGEFVTDDYLRITVNDNFSTGISSIRMIVNGFTREF